MEFGLSVDDDVVVVAMAIRAGMRMARRLVFMWAMVMVMVMATMVEMVVIVWQCIVDD